MRKIIKINKDGDIRIIRKFLWFPRLIGNEVRWLEYATIKQEYDAGMVSHGWDDVEFMNK